MALLKKSDFWDNPAIKLEDGWHAFRLRRAEERGWVQTVFAFRGYGLSDSWVRVMARVVMAREEAFENGLPLPNVVTDGVRGWRNFTSAPVPYAEVRVRVAGSEFYVDADRGGVVDIRIRAKLPAGWHTIELLADGGEPSHAHVYVVDQEQTFGIVSDIDDTVVVTALPRPLLAAWNSFVLDEHARVPTPGMAVMLERLVQHNVHAPVIYLSTGAWNVAQTLQRFLKRNLYPKGPLLLTDWGPTEGRWFRSGMQHKVNQLRRLADEFPDVKWLLIGDDGQHDPEIYAEFARRYPDHVRAIVIRQLTPSEAVLAGGRSEEMMGSTPGTPWIYEPDGAKIAAKLEKLGLLPAAQADSQVSAHDDASSL
ncbi:App1 family protein [Neomicrococcus aestuarii]|uniref:ACP synthase n=1 Tax=Neomicrococcus aestuarii TaxID=556325 RepID=A0A1L2ZMB5_9MICC|nr:phosphatase domain-containing protein [Neomicrococcus aestuarii]APF40585.1 ACP synthase [Neomicrococcus aestuarii]MBB5512276.1 phosphatidate phosphatase APP1 [Neomicrococcus aestuarii]